MHPAVYIRCPHPVPLVFQHISRVVAQLFAAAFVVVNKLKVKLAASSAKASGATCTCVLWQDATEGHVYRNMTRVFSVVVHVNGSDRNQGGLSNQSIVSM